ncbi:MAG: sulfatase [Gemmatimonadota bacterium]|nr:sulfatase [Gemmatimonadota bacterium]
MTRLLRVTRRVGFRGFPSLVLGCVVALGCSEESTVRAGGDPPNVLLVVLDACRADKFSTFGFDRPTTPNLDGLAADPDAVVFREHHAQAAWTKPSTASLFTGRYPSEHHVEIDPGFSADFQTLAEYFQDADFHTFAMATNRHLKPRFGFAQGFDDYVFGPVRIAEKVGWRERLTTAAMSTKVLWWARHLAQDQTWMWSFVPKWSLPRDSTKMAALSRMLPALPEPYFGYTHFQGCHFPFTEEDRDRRYIDQYAIEHDETSRVAVGVDFAEPKIAHRVNRGEIELSEGDVHYLNLLYEAKTFLADDVVIGGLTRLLRETGQYDRTLIIVTSDHGEALADHEAFGHHSVFQEVLKIPLLVKFPRGQKPEALSERVTGITHTIDLLPSLLAFFDFAPQSELPGADIFSGQTHDVTLAQSMLEEPDDQPAYWKSRSARSAEFKLREFRDDFELYDLRRDPNESQDVSDAHPDELSALRSALDPLRESEMSILGESQPGSVPEVDPETERWLRAMGYVE